MRFVKALLLLILFFVGVLFFVQNGEALAKTLTLKFDLYYGYKWQSLEVPFYFVVLSAFAVGMLFAILYLFIDRVRLSCVLIGKNRTIRDQEKELETIKLRHAKEVQKPLANAPADAPQQLPPAEKPLPQAG